MFEYIPNYMYYYSVYIFPLLLLISYYFSGLTTFIIPVVTFVVLPFLEYIMGDQKEEVIDNNEKNNQIKGIYYLLPIYIWVPVQLLLLYFFLQGINQFHFFDMIVFSISVGIVNGGIGINVAHELIHKKSFIEKTVGKILLCSVCYGHFFIEHIFNHHLNVGTEKDNATAIKNENVYSFVYRSIIGSYNNAYNIGRRKKINPVHIFSGISIIYLLTSFLFYGIYGFLFILIQSIVAIIMLEMTNYIEHYGLVRSKDEIVNVFHSWNTDKKITNYITFKLQRHSDHHINKMKEYQNLEYKSYYPTLPTGYTGSLLISLIPPLWFHIMNEKLKNYNKKMF